MTCDSLASSTYSLDVLPNSKNDRKTCPIFKLIKTKLYLIGHLFRSRCGGLVLAPLYGFFTYLYVTNFLLSGIPFTESAFHQTNQSHVRNSSNTTQSQHYSILHQPLMTEMTSHWIGAGIGGTLGVSLSLHSIYSVRSRCTMVVVLPNLFAKRGRSFILTMVGSFLISGPLENMGYNFKEILHSFSCMYDEVKVIIEFFFERISAFWNINKRRKRSNEEIAVASSKPNNVGELLQSSTIKAITLVLLQKTIKDILNEELNFLKFIAICLRKLFYLAIILVVYDAIRYQKRYYTDDTFDNMFVDSNLRRLWRKKRLAKLTPIRKWELQKGYQIATSVKISHKETRRIMRTSVQTIIITLIAIILLITDYSFVKVLYLWNDQNTVVHFQKTLRKELQIAKQKKHLDKSYNISEAMNILDLPCLPQPSAPSDKITILILCILFVCLLSCIFDAYASRLRARVCNFFYRDRAAQRALYLYNNILNGRKNRHAHFPMILLQELDKRSRIREFALSRRFYHPKTPVDEKLCPGCNYELEPEKKVELIVEETDSPQILNICTDCYKDM